MNATRRAVNAAKRPVMTRNAQAPGRTVSVVIPTFNRAASVGDAINTVLAQVPPPDEVIVVDDGSTDHSAEILAGYGDRITVLRRPNGGAAAARNTGLRHARGDWVAFLDSDDLWMPGRLAALHRDLDAAGDDIVAHTADMRMTGEGYDTTLSQVRGWSFRSSGAQRIVCPVMEALTGLFSSVTALRRDLALAEGGFREDRGIYEDAPLFCDLALRGPWLFSGDVLAEIRRLPMDHTPVSSYERDHPIEGASDRVKLALGVVNHAGLPSELRDRVRQWASGALYTLAAAEVHKAPLQARRTLMRAARMHPSRVVGWLRALPPLVLGRRGFDLVLRRRSPRRGPDRRGEDTADGQALNSG